MSNPSIATEAIASQTAEAPPASSQPSDEALMQGIINRDSRALDQLYGRYRALLGKIVLEILPNESDAEEALQDILLEIWRRAGNFDVKKGKPLGWIICMTRRRAIDHYRKIRRRAEAGEKLRLETQESDGGGDRMTSHTTPGTEALAMSDLRHFLHGIMGSLPAEQEHVVQLSYFNELSQREIASRTGIPLGTIKTRLDLALRKLAQKSMPFREELYYAN
jgi:RNA polymerase sigma-70 factor (ECF subfamily)